MFKDKIYVYDIRIDRPYPKHFVAEFSSEIRTSDTIFIKGIAYDVFTYIVQPGSISDILRCKPRITLHYKVPITEREVFD